MNIINKHKILEDFLHTEINENCYNDILKFIEINEIRNGEYKCQKYIIKKINNLNFIIYKEEYNKNYYEDCIINPISIQQDFLVQAIKQYVLKNKN